VGKFVTAVKLSISWRPVYYRKNIKLTKLYSTYPSSPKVILTEGRKRIVDPKPMGYWEETSSVYVGDVRVSSNQILPDDSVGSNIINRWDIDIKEPFATKSGDSVLDYLEHGLEPGVEMLQSVRALTTVSVLIMSLCLAYKLSKVVDNRLQAVERFPLHVPSLGANDLLEEMMSR
jgi:hypothetical protein